MVLYPGIPKIIWAKLAAGGTTLDLRPPPGKVWKVCSMECSHDDGVNRWIGWYIKDKDFAVNGKLFGRMFPVVAASVTVQLNMVNHMGTGTLNAGEELLLTADVYANAQSEALTDGSKYLYMHGIVSEFDAPQI